MTMKTVENERMKGKSEKRRKINNNKERKKKEM